MSKPVSINRKKFLGSYSTAQANQLVPGNAIFLVGVAATIIFPVIAYCSNNGPISPSVFGAVGSMGLAIGLLNYRLRRTELVTRLNVANVPRIPPGENIKLKKAS